MHQVRGELTCSLWPFNLGLFFLCHLVKRLLLLNIRILKLQIRLKSIQSLKKLHVLYFFYPAEYNI